MALRCLVFDCDGVLLDSVPVKTHAFGKLVEDYGEEAKKAMVEYHQAHGGVSRYQKFAWFYQNFLKRDITPPESEALSKRFATICLEELKSCSLIKGALETLRFWQHKIPLYVCSGAPTEEQTSVLKSHNLDSFFEEILGSPPPKALLLQKIVEKAKVKPSQTLMVGDAFTDLKAAKEVGTLFYGVGSQLKGGDYPWGQDLTDLTSYIKSISEKS